MLDGHLLNERYQVKKTIGGGGMANVYLADDLILNREVAIKVLRLEYANDQEFITRFDREAQAATSLAHPNIVNIYDVGEEEHILYMVMEYVEGMTLKEYIYQHGPLEVTEAIAIMKQITSAIEHAHANDIVHRDIKPQNIMIDTYGNAKVTDFGIAVALSATALTQTNSILGSVHYLSPEQARGGTATKRSDIYSLGIVFYEMLTGQIPFSGESAVSIALKHLQNDIPPVRESHPNIPQSVENIVLRSMCKDPLHRYQTVTEMEDSLNRALDSEVINEKKYYPPVEEGDKTKAIPIITDSHADDTNQRVDDSTTKLTPLTDTDKKDKKSKKKRKKFWLIIFIILVLLLAAGTVGAYFIFVPKDVEIPSELIEMDYKEAVTVLEELDLKAEQEFVNSDDIEEGLIVKTKPTTGKVIKENSIVTLYVSEGKETFIFDDYVGKDFGQVKRLLEDKGYEVIDYEKYSDKQEGEIISQIQPQADVEVVPTATKVIFEVSDGPEKISLNNLNGMTEGEAKDYLEKAGLSMNKKEEYSDTTPTGEVTRQSPETNAALEKGSTVDVHISIGQKQKPPSSHTVTFTVPYSLETNDEEDEEDINVDEDDDPQPQDVKIYIEDKDHSISNVFEEEEITKDTEYSITLIIEPGEVADYKVVRENDILIDKSVPYKEGD